MKNAWDKFSDLLGKTILHPQYFLKSYEHQAISVAKKYAKGILVDIGCGRQPYRKDLLPHVGRYIGVDHPNVSKLYKNKSKPDILADATDIPIKSNYCNVALMISVLEHLPQPEKAVKEANRILTKGGYLVLITVQNYVLHDAPFDFFRYTRFGLRELLSSNKFRIITIKPLGSFPELIGQYFNVLLLYKVKALIIRKETRFLGYLALPFIYIICLISNLVVFVAKIIFGENKNGTFAIYNLALAKKV